MSDAEGAESYDFEDLAKQIVSDRLREGGATDEAVAEVLKKIITAGVLGTKTRQDPAMTIRGAVKGALSGVLLAEKSLTEAAMSILEQVANIASETSLDPTETMTWAMEGIAGVAALASAEVQTAIQEAIEQKYMGAGSVFSDLLEKARPKT